MVEDHIACGGPCEVPFEVLDGDREARAWENARNVPADVMTEREFLTGEYPPNIPGLAAHTEAAVRRIAHNSIVQLDARDEALGDLTEALSHLFDDDNPADVSLRLPAVRRAWQSLKETL